MAEASRPPEAVRERVDRLGGARLACAVIFDRGFTPEELRRFLALISAGEYAPFRFRLEGRIVRYECPEAEEARWRLALEILVVKSHAASPRRAGDAARVFARERVPITVDLGAGSATARVLASDLGHDDVSLNTDYRS